MSSFDLQKLVLDDGVRWSRAVLDSAAALSIGYAFLIDRFCRFSSAKYQRIVLMRVSVLQAMDRYPARSVSLCDDCTLRFSVHRHAALHLRSERQAIAWTSRKRYRGTWCYSTTLCTLTCPAFVCFLQA